MRFSELLGAHDMTAYEVSRRTGLDYNIVWRLAHDRAEPKNMRVVNFLKLSRALDVDPVELMRLLDIDNPFADLSAVYLGPETRELLDGYLALGEEGRSTARQVVAALARPSRPDPDPDPEVDAATGGADAVCGSLSEVAIEYGLDEDSTEEAWED